MLLIRMLRWMEVGWNGLDEYGRGRGSWIRGEREVMDGCIIWSYGVWRE